MKRQRWVHEVIPGKVHPQIPTDRFNTCAICRETFDNTCPSCFGVDLAPAASIVEMMLDCKTLWATMLLYFKRAPFNLLDRSILTKIYTMALPEQQELHSCKVVQLFCGHVYHDHCIRRWLSKRECCPLDNDYMSIEFLDHGSSHSTQVQVSPSTMELTETYELSNSDEFVTRKMKFMHQKEVEASIIRTLKHTFPSKWALETLCNHYNTENNTSLKLCKLEEILENLCADEYVKKIEPGVFQYNP